MFFLFFSNTLLYHFFYTFFYPRHLPTPTPTTHTQDPRPPNMTHDPRPTTFSYTPHKLAIYGTECGEIYETKPACLSGLFSMEAIENLTSRWANRSLPREERRGLEQMKEGLLQILLTFLLVKRISYFLILFPSYSIPFTIFTIGGCPFPKLHKLLESGKSFLKSGEIVKASEPGIRFSHGSFWSSKVLT